MVSTRSGGGVPIPSLSRGRGRGVKKNNAKGGNPKGSKGSSKGTGGEKSGEVPLAPVNGAEQVLSGKSPSLGIDNNILSNRSLQAISSVTNGLTVVTDENGQAIPPPGLLPITPQNVGTVKIRLEHLPKVDPQRSFMTSLPRFSAVESEFYASLPLILPGCPDIFKRAAEFRALSALCEQDPQAKKDLALIVASDRQRQYIETRDRSKYCYPHVHFLFMELSKSVQAKELDEYAEAKKRWDTGCFRTIFGSKGNGKFKAELLRDYLREFDRLLLELASFEARTYIPDDEARLQFFRRSVPRSIQKEIEESLDKREIADQLSWRTLRPHVDEFINILDIRQLQGFQSHELIFTFGGHGEGRNHSQRDGSCITGRKRGHGSHHQNFKQERSRNKADSSGALPRVNNIDLAKIKCLFCDRDGHFEKQCPERLKKIEALRASRGSVAHHGAGRGHGGFGNRPGGRGGHHRGRGRGKNFPKIGPPAHTTGGASGKSSATPGASVSMISLALSQCNSVQSHQVIALCDTGATVSVASKLIAKEFGINSTRISCDILLKAATGETFSASERVDLLVPIMDVDGFVFNAKIHVLLVDGLEKHESNRILIAPKQLVHEFNWKYTDLSINNMGKGAVTVKDGDSNAPRSALLVVSDHDGMPYFEIRSRSILGQLDSIDTARGPGFQVKSCRLVGLTEISCTDSEPSTESPMIPDLDIFKDLVGLSDEEKAVKVVERVHANVLGHQHAEYTYKKCVEMGIKHITLKRIKEVLTRCSVCPVNNFSPNIEAATNRASRFNEILQQDLLTLDNGMSSSVIVDKFSGWLSIKLISSQSSASAASHLIDWIAENGNRKNRSIVSIVVDRGASFIGDLFESTATRLGISLDYGIPHTPQSQGVVERANSSILIRLRSVRSVLNVTEELDGEGTLAAVQSIMRVSPRRSNPNQMSPWEAKNQSVPPVPLILIGDFVVARVVGVGDNIVIPKGTPRNAIGRFVAMVGKKTWILLRDRIPVDSDDGFRIIQVHSKAFKRLPHVKAWPESTLIYGRFESLGEADLTIDRIFGASQLQPIVVPHERGPAPAAALGASQLQPIVDPAAHETGPAQAVLSSDDHSLESQILSSATTFSSFAEFNEGDCVIFKQNDRVRVGNVVRKSRPAAKGESRLVVDVLEPGSEGLDEPWRVVEQIRLPLTDIKSKHSSDHLSRPPVGVWDQLRPTLKEIVTEKQNEESMVNSVMSLKVISTDACAGSGSGCSVVLKKRKVSFHEALASVSTVTITEAIRQEAMVDPTDAEIASMSPSFGVLGRGFIESPKSEIFTGHYDDAMEKELGRYFSTGAIDNECVQPYVPTAMRPSPMKSRMIIGIKTPNRKARLVQQGFLDQIMVSTFAPTPDRASIRTALAAAKSFGFNLAVSDVRTAFLQAPIEGTEAGGVERFMQMPRLPESVINRLQNKGFDLRSQGIYRVRHALYGYRFAPRVFALWIREKLLSLGYVMVAECVFVMRSPTGGISTILVVYVDDLLAMGSDPVHCLQQIKDKGVDLDDIHPFLPGEENVYIGLTLRNADGYVTLGLSKYLAKIDLPPGVGDYVPSKVECPRSQPESAEITAEYLKWLGIVGWIATALLQMAYIHSVMGSHACAATSERLRVLMQTVKVCKHLSPASIEMTYGQLEGQGSAPVILGWSDASYKARECRSRGGFVVQLAKKNEWLQCFEKVKNHGITNMEQLPESVKGRANIIAYRAFGINRLTLSTTGAESLAMCEMIKTLAAFVALIESIWGETPAVYVIIDSKPLLGQLQARRVKGESRLLGVLQWCLQEIEAINGTVMWCSTSVTLADQLTKALPIGFVLLFYFVTSILIFFHCNV